MLEALIGIMGVALMGVIGWAFQLSNRVSVVETAKTDLKELIEVRFDDVCRRLERIENKVLNGQHK